MVKVVALLKFMVSFAGFVFVIMTFFNLKMNNITEKIAAIAIIALICGIYIYYLILTGIWNLANKAYKINVLLIAGILIHFVFISALVYFSYTSFPFAVFLTSAFVSCFGIAIGVFDAKKLLGGWKNRKSALN